MIKRGKFKFLGTGGSMGVPVLGCKCAVCLSDNPKNNRTRPSGLITIDDNNLLIDCGPDFRQQALREKISQIDGIIMTHAHYDHIGGIDDLRAYFLAAKNPLPCLLSQATSTDILRRFDYMFRKPEGIQTLLPKLQLNILKDDRGETIFQGVKLRYLTFEQIGMKVNGIVMGNMAYMSDICHYPESVFEDLQGIDILVVSALRFTPSPFHFTVDEAIAFAERVGAKQTWLTHIAHELDHEKTNTYLPSNVRMAYDGLEFDFFPEVPEI